MKVYTFNFTDIKGGAAIASHRIHTSLRKRGIDSTMIVYRKFSNDLSVVGPSNLFSKIYRIFRQKLGQSITFFFKRDKKVFNSPSLLPTNWASRINKSDADIIHLHWINLDFISIEDISAISKPLVWTLHDMWAFCGAEHLAWNDFDYVNGYPVGSNSLFNLNRWVWKRKKKAWQIPIHIVTPSQWLADCAKKSSLMCNWPIHVIPNPIDISQWLLLDKLTERENDGILASEKIILFSTSEDLFAYHKGFDLLLEALSIVAQNVSFTLLVIGSNAPKETINTPFKIKYMGFIKSVVEMNHFISISDLVVVPSRQESLSYVAMESITCERPVVAFDNTGITDVIMHMYNGYLAKAFDTTDMAKGISMLLEDEGLATKMGQNGRKYTELHFESSVIAERYIDLYHRVLSERNNTINIYHRQ
jgi:glycosyltransferase involved in cell wall biosynthesis